MEKHVEYGCKEFLTCFYIDNFYKRMYYNLIIEAWRRKWAEVELDLFRRLWLAEEGVSEQKD